MKVKFGSTQISKLFSGRCDPYFGLSALSSYVLLFTQVDTEIFPNLVFHAAVEK